MRSRYCLIAILGLLPGLAGAATFQIVIPDEIRWSDGRELLATDSNGFDVLYGQCNDDGSMGAIVGGYRTTFTRRKFWLGVPVHLAPCLQVRVIDKENRWIGSSHTYDLRKPQDFKMPMPPIILDVLV